MRYGLGEGPVVGGTWNGKEGSSSGSSSSGGFLGGQTMFFTDLTLLTMLLNTCA